MCLILKNQKQRTPKVARKNIVVYKMLIHRGKILESPFRSFEYKPGEVYTSELKLVKSYYMMSWDRWIINEGLHAYTKNPRPWSKHIYKMTIPKGALYYEGTNGDIVTDILIFATPD